jgi:hypothetical protein
MQPDANVSGPIIIPKLYDGRNKTFFFFGYQKLIEPAIDDGRFPESATFRKADFRSDYCINWRPAADEHHAPSELVILFH